MYAPLVWDENRTAFEAVLGVNITESPARNRSSPPKAFYFPVSVLLLRTLPDELLLRSSPSFIVCLHLQLTLGSYFMPGSHNYAPHRLGIDATSGSEQAASVLDGARSGEATMLPMRSTSVHDRGMAVYLPVYLPSNSTSSRYVPEAIASMRVL